MGVWPPEWLTSELPTSSDPVHGWPPAWWIGVASFVALTVYPWLRRWWEAHGTGPAPRWARAGWIGALTIAAVVSVANYVDYGLYRYGTYANEWDTYHYYLGSKYAAELGYEGLYVATLLADVEASPSSEPSQTSRQVRDLSDYSYSDAEALLPRAQEVRRRFSDERWTAFTNDVAWFRASLPKERWGIVLTDAGYNATPAWSWLIRTTLTSRLDMAAPIERFLMLSLDPLLLGLAFALVWRAFGLEMALWMVILIGTHYLFSWGHLKGALLRTDFATAAVMSVALLKLHRPYAAGAALAWASLSRVFPGLLALGVLVRLGAPGSDKAEQRQILRFVASFAAIGLLGIGVSLFAPNGLDMWSQWATKISTHQAEGSHWGIGLSTVFNVDLVAGVPEYFNPRHRLSEEPSLRMAHTATLWLCRAALAVPALVFARAMPPHRALAFCFVLIFVLVSAAYYYYLILLVALLFLGEHRIRPLDGFATGFLFLAGSVGYLLFSGWDALGDVVALRGWGQQFQTYYYMSWLIGITVVAMFVIAARDARR